MPIMPMLMRFEGASAPKMREGRISGATAKAEAFRKVRREAVALLLMVYPFV
jgi:hypothetical protein